MEGRPRGALAWVLAILGIAILLVAAAAGVQYARDAALEADVVGVDCGGLLADDDANRVHVRTRFLGIDHTVRGLPDASCGRLEPGQYVTYRMRSKHTTLYESKGGDCIWDSEAGDC